MSQRYIAHFDLDSFFVSVEVINNPSLKGKPVLVGGHSERGVVAACSYEARKFGIHSAMPMKKAMQLCPHAIITNSSRGEYSRYSRWVTNIIAEEAPVFEKASIDEFYLDLMGMDKYFVPFEWTQKLRQRIIDETHLPISFALASNKLIAKIATDVAKPNGFIWVRPGEELAFLDPLRVNKIPGVGEETYKKLVTYNIETIKDIRLRKREEMEMILGKYGGDLWERANGIHTRIVQPYHEAKSISTENTFEENKTDVDFLLVELVRMAEKVAYELRQDDKTAGCIAVKIRYADFETTTKQATIPYTFYDDELIRSAKELFHKSYRKGQSVRLIGVRLSELTDEAMQTSLFTDVQKKSGLYKAIDDVKNKFGSDLLTKAAVKQNEQFKSEHAAFNRTGRKNLKK
ncbi:DNA polymerase IV [Pinibacter soli]|uniref:DNA polymerase IV n=1 Tax=Pinibacter soli TaxID=3044211 RepID=A0ABT6R6M5_9BACT|nr:DNA polymerase IV [Pinibacter soli]MDI3318220.1 DNA polymerase IV [Pinibacter soli]